MMNQRYAAIDQGTTGTRVVVFGEDGRHHSPASMPHKQITPNPGWVEHDATEILANIRRCLSQCDMVDAIGLGHQGESLLAWGRRQRPAAVQRHRLARSAHRAGDPAPETRRRRAAGDGENRPAARYLLLRQQDGLADEQRAGGGQLAQRGRLRLGTMDAFFLFHLCGRHLTDYNSASRTSLFNIHTLQWDEELCRLFGVPIDSLPEVRDNIGHFGDVALNGKPVPLTACIVDQFAGTYGHGCHQPGQMKITFGTGAFLQAITGPRPIDAGESGLLPTLCWKLPGSEPVYGTDGGVYNAASAINWARKIGLFNDFDEFGDFPAQPAIARGTALYRRSPGWPARIGIAPPPGYGPACRWKPNARICCSRSSKASPCVPPR